MKTYLVRISRKSIKANPDAGQTSAHELISTTVTITINGSHESLEKINDRIKLTTTNFSVTNQSKATEQSNYIFNAESDEVSEIMEQIAKKYGKQMTYHLENHFQHIDFMTPIASHNYEYLKTKVQCQHCKSKFTHDKLRDYDDWDYEGCYIGRSMICPECDKEDACKLQFESFELIALKKAGL